MPNLPEHIKRDLDALCTVLEDELERQHGVLAAVQAQGLAARRQDLDELDKRTAGLNILLNESLQSERERLRLLSGIVTHFGLAGAGQTLSNLIAAAPEPWKHRMAEFQIALRETVGSSRQGIHANAGLMRKALKRADGAIAAMLGEDAERGRPYAADGADARPNREASLLDAMG